MDRTIKDALRLAQSPRNPIRFHHTMARRGYAFGGPSEQDEADTEAFLKEELKGSAPQYEPEAGLKTAKEAGLMAAGLIPGTGLAAAAGKFPTAEGGFEPSLKEDIQSGQYLSAGLKGLGAAGDVLQAVPVVGTAAGAALKAPLAVKLASAMAPAARLAREAKAVEEAAPVAREAEATLPTKSQSQAAMKAAWEAGTGDTSKYKNWQHQWNVEQGPQFKAQPAAATAAVEEALPPAEAPAYQRLVNPAGFYSRAHEAAMLELPPEPRTWQEMHSLLSKAPRVQAEELYWSGIHPETFSPGEKVSREQIAELIEKNFPKVAPEIRKAGAEVRPKYEGYTVPGGTDYEERILRNPYEDPRNLAGEDYVHPDIEAKYDPERLEINQERNRITDEINRARRDYQKNVFNPYVQSLRETYIQKLLGDTRVTTPEELAASLAARDAAEVEMDQANAAYSQVLNSDAPREALRGPRQAVMEANKKYEDLADNHAELYENSEAGIREDIGMMNPAHIANALGNYNEFYKVKVGLPEEEKSLEAAYAAQEERLKDLRNKMVSESKELAPYVPEYAKEQYTHSHWDNTNNPVVHTRNSTRMGPEGEKIWHQEEIQSDWAQEGREKGFKDPKSEEARTRLEKDRDAAEIDYRQATIAINKKYQEDARAASPEYYAAIDKAKQEFYSSPQRMSDINKFNQAEETARQFLTPEGDILEAQKNKDLKDINAAYTEKRQNIADAIRSLPKQGVIPSAPYTRDTEHWLELAAKDTLKEAIERGYDKIFITGGQEQAKRWANELRKAVDQVTWEGGAAGEKVVMAKPTGGGEAHRFVVQPTEGPGGKQIYKIVDSDIAEAKDQSLSSVIGGDLARRVIAEDSGNVPMKNYRMGSEGYTQTYERKAPSVYKKILRSLDPEAKVEAGALPKAGVQARDLRSVQDDLLLDDAGDDYADRWRSQLDEMYSYMSRNGMSFEQAARAIGADRALINKVQEAVANKPDVGGTYIQITPKMRAEYNRLKEKFGSVFPAYKQGGRVGYAVGGPSEQDEADQEEFLRGQLEGSAPQYEPEAGLKTAKEAALMAAGLIPGTGLAAAAGKFPTAEGGFEPSLKEDVKAGRYGSALLKGAGAAGDVLQAVPVVGTAAGAAMKAPLAAKLAMAMTPAARKAAKIAQKARAGNEVEESVSLAKKVLDKAPPAPEEKQFSTGPLQGPVKYPGKTPQEALTRVPYVSGEFLAGKSYFPIFADLTSAGKEFKGIDSSELQKAINTYGGPLYPLINENQIADLGWAVRGKGRGTSKVSKPADYAVVLGMSPETHKSNTTFGNALIGAMEAYGRDQRLSPENLAAINALVRNPGAQKELAKLKEFPGFESPEAAPFIDALSFEARKKLSETLGSAKAQELGAPNMTKLIRELTEPQYHGYNRHDALMLLELAKDREEGLIDLANAGLPPHPGYPYGFHGRVVGQFPPGVSGRGLFPDYFAKIDAENQVKKELAAAEGKTARIEPERAFEMALPIQTVSEELATQLPLEKMDIQSPRAARLAVNAANDAWQDSATAVNRGGLSTSEFARALRNSESSSTLSPYSAEELTKKIREGKFEGYKLKDGEVYFGLEPNKDYKAEYGFEHEDLGPNEKALVSVVNNEPGAKGIGGPAVMFKALEQGATVLDAYAVPSAAHPKGFLPQYYNKFGFEELGRIQFDPAYVTPQQFEDMKRVWRKDGWDESIGLPELVIMKWRGNDADRAGGLQRFIQSRSERTGQRSDIAAAAGAIEPAGRTARRPAGAAQGEPEVAVERGNQGRLPDGRPTSPADKLARTLSETFRMSEPQAKSWGLSHADMLATRKKLLGYDTGGIVGKALRITSG